MAGRDEQMPFSIFTVGWNPDFAHSLLTPIGRSARIQFVHGLVGDAARVSWARNKYPVLHFVSVSKADEEPLPEPDTALLARLESRGVPSVQCMVRGDNVLRYRSEREALGYATLLARRLMSAFEEHKPDVVLASHDSLHSAMSLAVAKSMEIPWVALVFPVIPDNLTGFCKALVPDALVPLEREIDERLRELASRLMDNVRSKRQAVMAYHAPTTFGQLIRQYSENAAHFLRRWQRAKELGPDRYTYATGGERLADLLRRFWNRWWFPKAQMIWTSPEAKYAYFPLHMAPESMLDTWAPFYQDQIGFVRQLALSLPIDMELVVKLHFSDPDNYSRKQLLQLMSLPRIRIAHPNSSGAAYLERSSLVIGIQGTSNLEAALLGKPVLLFGDSPYQHFPRVERARRPHELQAQITDMLAATCPAKDEIVEAYAEYMARYMLGRINDWTRPNTAEDMEHLSACFAALKDHVVQPGVRRGWYKAAPFVPKPAERATEYL